MCGWHSWKSHIYAQSFMEWIVISFSGESFQHRDWTHISCVSCIGREILYPWATSPKRWCCESATLNMPANLENSAVATGLEKVNFYSNPKERQCQRMLKLPHNWLISHASKVMLKILQARLQQYVNCELPDVQAGFKKAEEPEIKMPTSIWSSRKWESSRKTSTSALLTIPKPLTVWITTNCGKFFKRWESQTTSPASWAVCMQVRNQETTVRTGHGATVWFQIGKGVHLGCILSRCLFNVKCWVEKLKSRLPGEISITSDMQMTLPLWQKAKNN